MYPGTYDHRQLKIWANAQVYKRVRHVQRQICHGIMVLQNLNFTRKTISQISVSSSVSSPSFAAKGLTVRMSSSIGSGFISMPCSSHQTRAILKTFLMSRPDICHFESRATSSSPSRFNASGVRPIKFLQTFARIGADNPEKL